MINRSKAEFDFWPFQPLKRHKLEWAPHVETFDLKDLTLIRLRLPGLELTEFEVSVEGDCLVMRGSRKPQAAGDDEYFHCTDCAAGEFYGSFRLPEGTIVEGIKASYRNGVLEVRIPRPVSRDPRKLVIEVE
jgi:HSP20 family protein